MKRGAMNSQMSQPSPITSIPPITASTPAAYSAYTLYTIPITVIDDRARVRAADDAGALQNYGQRRQRDDVRHDVRDDREVDQCAELRR